ncbi:MAG: hypothetical protein EBX50_06360 [Chitinophagia bacterium]|nr:hypothetical protein [Chitinophagia bacterium]
MVFGYFPQLCTMQIMLIAAKPTEILLSKEALGNLCPTKGTLNVFFTDVGLTAATFSITRLALTHQPDLIIQAGIAGSFQSPYVPGEVMLVQNESIADLGVQESNGWKDVFQLSLTNSHEIPFENGGLPNPYLHHFSFLQLPVVDAVSVNQISTDVKTIARIQQTKPTTVLESMEGAALHYVARKLMIPFIQIRAVSNRVGERDKSLWHLPLAINNLQIVLSKILLHLQQLPVDYSFNKIL